VIGNSAHQERDELVKAIHLAGKGGFRLASVAVIAAAVLLAACAAEGKVTVLQQGVSPASDYAGCVDTFIVGHGWAHDRPISRPRSPALSVHGRNGSLMRFDLAGIEKGRTVRGAILRLHFAAIPSFGQAVEVYTLTREWDSTATWYEYKYLDAKKTDANNWAKFGGELDETDFGKKKPGLIATAVSRGGPFGHVVELDVTKLVGEWVARSRPNYGFLIATERGGVSIASSEWPMPAYRPALVVEHYAAGERAPGAVKLTLPEALGPKPKLSPVARAAEVQAAQPLTTLRFGRNSNCQYRRGHAAGYAKQDPRFGGNWGWTPRLRIGGTAGDFNHAAFHFDLSAIPKGATIGKARLRAFADVGNLRLPADTLGQTPPADKLAEQNKRIIQRCRGTMSALMKYSFGVFAITGEGAAPGWSEAEFTFATCRAGRPWTGKDGTLIGATEPLPAAVADAGQQWAEPMKVRDKLPETWLEWDVTGLVRAWVGGKMPNRGVVLDGRLMGGAMTIFSDDWIEPDRRPYLEVRLSPAPTAKPDGPFQPEPLLPAGDYWLGPMKKAHARFTGTKGTFAQYGDSISITMAFWTPLLYGERTGGPPEMTEALETARKVIHRPCWRNWKGPAWGNNGNMTIAWAFANIDAWQKKMHPEVGVILFGTNDFGYGPHPPIYTEKYAAVIDRMLADGSIPIITALPPHGRQKGNLGGLLRVLDLRQAAIAVAKAKKVPLIDFYTEVLTRQPEKWREILIPDGLHPSYPKQYQRNWSEEGFKHSGYTLRNYLTLRTWHEIYTKVLLEKSKASE